MSNLQMFNFNQQQGVRVKMDANKQPWFCLADICKILNIKSASDVKKRLNNNYLAKNEVVTTRGTHDIWFVAEPNLYELIFCANKEEAKRFKAWVFEEVLPQIRKADSYTNDTEEKITDADWQILRAEIESIKRFFHRDDREDVDASFAQCFHQVKDNPAREIHIARAFQVKIQKFHSEVSWLYSDYRRKQNGLLSELVKPRVKIKFDL